MQELLHGAWIFLLYLAPMAVILLTVRKFLNIPNELFRKLLHFVLLGGYFPFLFGFQTWWISAGFALVLILILYPVLTLAGRLSFFSAFVNERKKGEFKSSMILALLTVVMSITICWGIFGDKLLTLACVYAWGIGDAFAALVGKRFGKHKIKWRFADGKKSVEGSAAMFLCALISVFAILCIRGGIHGALCFVIALLAALVCTLSELCTKNGLDTIICPLSAMAVIIPLTILF